MNTFFEHVPRLGILQIFETAQKCQSSERLLKSLFNIFSKSNHSKFILEFIQGLVICMVNMEKQQSTERALEFAAKYCIYHSSLVEEDNNILLLAVFEFIFNNHNRKLPAIRFRTCEFVNRLLNKMGPQASLDDDVFQKMASTMLERLQDKLPTVRAQAVMALQRLQDPPNKNCRIIKAFMFHLETDPSCEVRTRVVQSIAVTQKTLPLIFGRLQDVKETVRKEAYRSLSRLKPRKLSILQRQTILKTGLSDRSDSVKIFIIDTVIPNWFSVCDSNLVDFLKILDVVSFKKETVTEVLSHIFKDLPACELLTVVERLQLSSQGQKLIPISKLTPETVVIWVSVIKHIGFDACYDAILPELSFFAKHIKKYSEETDLKDTDQQYILVQLLEISKLYSLMDEMGRNQLIQTSLDILKDDRTGTELIPPFVKLLEILITDVKQRMVIMAELLSDIREPLEPTCSADSLNNSVDAISHGLSNLNCESQSLDDCIRGERTDPDILIKCLTIAVEMLKSSSINKVDATLLSLNNNFIVKCCEVEDARVQRLALDAKASLCYRNIEMAKEYFLKFCIQITEDSTCVSAVEAVFDLIIIHGFESFTFGWDYSNNDQSIKRQINCSSKKDSPLDFNNDTMITNQATRKLVALLTNLLTSNVNDVKYKASQGLCKLLLSSRFDSYIALSHLIILWFSSASDTEPYIRQPLGLFFSIFTKRRRASDIILYAFTPTMRAIEQLIEEDINSMKVANLFITLLRNDICDKASKPEEGAGSYHAQLASIVLKEIKEEIIQRQVLVKTLSLLEFQDDDSFMAKDLEAEAQRVHKFLIKSSCEKRTLNIIKKFREQMSKLKTKFKDLEINDIPGKNQEADKRKRHGDDTDELSPQKERQFEASDISGVKPIGGEVEDNGVSGRKITDIDKIIMNTDDSNESSPQNIREYADNDISGIIPFEDELSQERILETEDNDVAGIEAAVINKRKRHEGTTDGVTEMMQEAEEKKTLFAGEEVSNENGQAYSLRSMTAFNTKASLETSSNESSPERTNISNGGNDIVEETSESSDESEVIATPSPPKKRMLRSHRKFI